MSCAIPDDVKAETREKLLALTKGSERDAGPFPIDKFFVRHWCEATVALPSGAAAGGAMRSDTVTAIT